MSKCRKMVVILNKYMLIGLNGKKKSSAKIMCDWQVQMRAVTHNFTHKHIIIEIVNCEF